MEDVTRGRLPPLEIRRPPLFRGLHAFLEIFRRAQALPYRFALLTIGLVTGKLMGYRARDFKDPTDEHAPLTVAWPLV